MTTTLDRIARMPKGSHDQTVCLTCPDEPQFESDVFSDHLAEAHHIPHDTAKSCHMALIYDSEDYYGVAYHWTVLHVEAEQFLQTPRPAESRAYWTGLKAVTV